MGLGTQSRRKIWRGKAKSGKLQLIGTSLERKETITALHVVLSDELASLENAL